MKDKEIDITTMKSLPINEAYKCCQFEGKFMGFPSLLIRFSGCSLRCVFSNKDGSLNSFCDTPHNSFSPEKGSFDLDAIDRLYKENPQIRYTIISGGESLIHGDIVVQLCQHIKDKYNHHITIETAGTDFVPTCADFISLSPKMSNSTPIVGVRKPWMTDSDKNNIVTVREKEMHEKKRMNFKAMADLLYHHSDFQLKFVVSNDKDITEIDSFIDELATIAPFQITDHNKMKEFLRSKITLMPAGVDSDEIQKKRQWLVERCIELGYLYTDRLHILIYGHKRFV